VRLTKHRRSRYVAGRAPTPGFSIRPHWDACCFALPHPLATEPLSIGRWLGFGLLAPGKLYIGYTEERGPQMLFGEQVPRRYGVVDPRRCAVLCEVMRAARVHLLRGGVAAGPAGPPTTIPVLN
jgi:hypothetical protein